MGDKTTETLDKWLTRLLSGGLCPGLEMVDVEQLIFHIPWRNEKRGGLKDGGNDTKFLRLWAEHKKYTIKDGGKEERRHWKEKFRNALNKCKDRVTKLEDDRKGSMICQFKDGSLPLGNETTLSGCKRKTERNSLVYEQNGGTKTLRITEGDKRTTTFGMASSNDRCTESFNQSMTLDENIFPFSDTADEFVPPFSPPMLTDEYAPTYRKPLIADEYAPTYRMPLIADEYAPTYRMPVTADEYAPKLRTPVENDANVFPSSHSADENAPPFRHSVTADENAPPFRHSVTADENAPPFRHSVTAHENMPRQSPMTMRTQTVNHFSQPGAAAVSEGATVSIEVMYNKHRVAVGYLTPRSTSCRVFSDIYALPDPLKERFRGSEESLELKLPPVDGLPNVVGEMKEKICEILEDMERGVIVTCANRDTIVVQRNCSIRCFLFDGISKSERVPRREGRHEEPVLIEAFDFQEFYKSVSSHMTKNTQCPKPYVFLTIGHEADTSDRRDPLFKVPVFIKITHQLADKYLHMALGCAESIPNPMLSGFTSLDHALNFLNDAESTSNSNRHLGELFLQKSDESLVPSDFNGNLPQAIMERNAPGQQGPDMKPLNDPHRNIQVQPVGGARQVPGELHVTIFYGVPHKQVKSETIQAGSCCRIFAPDVSLPVLQFLDDAGDGVADVQLPPVKTVNDLLGESQTKLNEILTYMKRGVIIKRDSGGIYVERRCVVRVFSTDGRSPSKLLTRGRTFEKVFDGQQFLTELRDHIGDDRKPRPQDEVILTLGNPINPEDDFPLRKVLAYIVIKDTRSTRAIHEAMAATGQSSEAKFSLMDSMDAVTKTFKDLNLKA
ncbi:unnamed protein product [Lymnaea stagnalis]|uniref:Interferon regulatory factor-3 domain-containing protein n=1 Tax=Lymnaea stagnalis TaxID=6523 RepID=A0AAV2H5E8_LYMST